MATGVIEDIIICDNGTGFVKTGFAGENLPRHVFPSMIGRPMLRAEEASFGDLDLEDVLVGDKAAAMRHGLEVSYPIENGSVRNWDDMEILWDYIFSEKLGKDPAGKSILLTEAPMNARENREKMFQTMFETYNFDRVQISTQAMLTLYAQGLMSGVVVDSGDGVTHVVAVADGFVMPHLTRRLDVAGRDITRYLIKLLLMRGYAFNRTADFQTVQEIKEKFCYTALNPDKEEKLALDTTVLMEKYTLPDGRVIKIGAERFQASEALFKPSVLDSEQEGLSDMVFNMIQKADVDVRMDFYNKIVLSGGSTMYPGLPSRLEHDLRRRYLNEVLKGDKKRLSKFQLNIEDPPRRKHMVFLGASVLGHIYASRDQWWISKAEWEEHGTSIVDRKGRM